ncbi:single stranded DNA-binding protein [Haloactinopolyspora alba]|uniref:Single-stranded DNA-binding protein n=1 Tax=Haloactinopolyspora alba TaxID=648780 RepID=A0A2P8EFA0_9ACTN|nr:single-stranded DNA-binding protein [Haloactinopolyspora alba]PSL08152.1 single stranded DNA-binding protein [Haloactinopolyspora alba]
MSNAFPATTPGRIATDPQYTGGANPRLTFRLAVDDRSQGQDGEWATRQTVFHDVVAFGRSAKTFADLYRKGDPVVISGEVRFNNYTTQAGENRTGTQIVARVVAPDPRLCQVSIDRTRQAERGAGADGPAPSAPQTTTQSGAAAEAVDVQVDVPPPPVPAPPPVPTPPTAAEAAARPRWPQQPTGTATGGVGV